MIRRAYGGTTIASSELHTHFENVREGIEDREFRMIVLSSSKDDANIYHVTLKTSDIMYLVGLLHECPLSAESSGVQWLLLLPVVYNAIKPEAWCIVLLERLLEIAPLCYFLASEVQTILSILRASADTNPQAAALLQMLDV